MFVKLYAGIHYESSTRLGPQITYRAKTWIVKEGPLAVEHSPRGRQLATEIWLKLGPILKFVRALVCTRE
jgi:hypothetical protein